MGSFQRRFRKKRFWKKMKIGLISVFGAALGATHHGKGGEHRLGHHGNMDDHDMDVLQRSVRAAHHGEGEDHDGHHGDMDDHDIDALQRSVRATHHGEGGDHDGHHGDMDDHDIVGLQRSARAAHHGEGGDHDGHHGNMDEHDLEDALLRPPRQLFADIPRRQLFGSLPVFPNEMEPNSRFWLEAAAGALNTANDQGMLKGHGLTSVTSIRCNRMNYVENAGYPGTVHKKHCNMLWKSLSRGKAHKCVTSFDVYACVMCRRAPFAIPTATGCTPEA